MNVDDFIYLFFLFLSIGLGPYYRKLPDVRTKKKFGALVGFLIILMVSRLHVIHILITILVNTAIILHVSKRHCHLVSFTFSFLYLIFFRTTAYFGIPYPPSHTNLIQMILTLKLVGLSFEVNAAYLNQKKKDEAKKSEEELAENSMSSFNLEASDIFCYGLHYIGVLTGPFYKYRTYYDHLQKPYSKHDNYKSVAFSKIFPLVPIFAGIYLITNYLWPLEYITTTDFEERTFLYRYWYIWPIFINFRMRIYIGLILSECACIMGGLGVYPSFAKSKPGNGPTEKFIRLKEVCNEEHTLNRIGYDYETVLNINPYGTEFYPTLREGMRNWNITVQYWLAMCVHKRFPSKKFRTFATMFVSSVWHGIYSGYYISFGMMLFGLIVEDVWVQVLLKDEVFVPQSVGYFIMLFLKMQFFSYAVMAFVTLDVSKIMNYYNSVHHWMVFFCIILYFIGKHLVKIKKMRQKEVLKANGAGEPIMKEGGRDVKAGVE